MKNKQRLKMNIVHERENYQIKKYNDKLYVVELLSGECSTPVMKAFETFEEAHAALDEYERK